MSSLKSLLSRFFRCCYTPQGDRRKDKRLEMHLTSGTSHCFFGQSLGCDKVPDKWPVSQDRKLLAGKSAL